MHPYPHLYGATAEGTASGMVSLTCSGLPTLETAPPPEFDGPGGVCSPETLLVAAIPDCFVLTFRGVARAAGLQWQKVCCDVEGTLERVAGVSQFTRYVTRATLTVLAGVDIEKAKGVLERAEKACLVANSLRGDRSLQCDVVVVPA